MFFSYTHLIKVKCDCQTGESRVLLVKKLLPLTSHFYLIFTNIDINQNKEDDNT